MNRFYISIIVIGIVIEIISFIWIIIDKKRRIDLKKVVDSKKEDLVEIIEDADVMVEELNKFSDYIVSEIDIREKKLEKIFNKTDKIINAQESTSEKYKNGTYGNTELSYKYLLDKTQMNINNIKKKNNNNNNVIHLNPKYRDVLDLKNSGMGIEDIAKKLNIGKGEVKLIINMLN
jgi:hypothetical protein